ncbi:lactate/malate family dehydrogenase [Vagococcus elongatus]|uniref:L-lactate dehydrogenase n=1 Tax=Vagococcus elongatus TaxID=180344 RepID=A0A430AQL1_9ENTE|nr:L-lactate dehydrogenase [Vagococcus elongatus]RSU10346.1 L-lactate dehydrogenase [Vagococcus elongatus]
MGKKVGIIGVGHVGSTTAYTLIQKQIADELVLFDKNEKIVEAEINDLIQGQIGNESTVRIKGNDLSQLASCDVFIFSAGKIELLAGGADRFEELSFTKKVVEEWAPKIKASGFNGILLSVTNPCDVIVRYLQELTGLPKNKIFGTGTSLDTARMKQAVGEGFGVHPNSVKGYVLWEHGETQFIAWSTVRIAEQQVANGLSAEKIEYLEKEASAAGSRIFLGKIYTCYGIANQAAKITKAILTDADVVIPVSAYSESEKLYIGQPALIGASGIKKTFDLTLTEDEQLSWRRSVEKIKEMYAAI